MANVLFKQGLQGALDVLRSGNKGVEGAFYLTTDSHRLYIGGQNGVITPVNEGVTTVANLSALPQIPDTVEKKALLAGQFYYVTEGNILCVFSGTKWVQINSNTDTRIEKFEVDAKDGTAANEAEVEIKITDSTQLGDGSTPWTGEFAIAVAGGLTLNVANGKISIDATDLAASLEHTLAGSTANNKFEVTLTRNGENAGTATLEGGDNVTIADNKISAKDTTLKQEGTAGEALDSGFKIKVADTKGNVVAATIDPAIQTKNDDGTATGTSVKFVNGVAVIDAYSTEAIDKKLRGIDALVYKGTVSSADDVTAKEANAEIGFTYKASADFVLKGTNIKAGDVLIANGTETGGKLTTVTWDVIPSGDEDIVTYVMSAIDGGVSLKDNGGNHIGSIVVKGETDNGVVVTDAKNGGDNTITVKHKEYSDVASESKGDVSMTAVAADGNAHVKNEITVTAVTGVVRDKFGHLTGIETKDYKIKDTALVMAAGETSVSAAENTATVTVTAKATDEASNVTSSATSFGVSSPNASVAVTASGTNVNIDLVWGSF